jgi:hypothetical protein
MFPSKPPGLEIHPPSYRRFRTPPASPCFGRFGRTPPADEDKVRLNYTEWKLILEDLETLASQDGVSRAKLIRDAVCLYVLEDEALTSPASPTKTTTTKKKTTKNHARTNPTQK